MRNRIKSGIKNRLPKTLLSRYQDYQYLKKYNELILVEEQEVELIEEAKPSVLNLNIIDSCNSKCTMCNIWRRDEELEITPEQLKEVLQDELFSELKHVGVTGGEPTLREDLPSVYEKIIEAVPGIVGLSIITNAIIEDDVKQRIKDVKAVCDKHNVGFSAMVSLDGVGKAHDNVRGTKGNFETAISVFNYLDKELKMPVAFGCTISKINAWDADDLLYFAKENGMYGRFRIAETINRLYNHNRGKVIRNFDTDETYNLLLFFEKLKQTFEENPTYQRTYSSIQNILQGGNRLIGCPYHNNGMVLGSKGQLSYCAPKSKELGNALEVSASKLNRDNFDEKRRIVKENCRSCVHDYHAPLTVNENKVRALKYIQHRFLTIDKVDQVVRIARKLDEVSNNSGKTSIFIFGWYGTETVGDKAILGGIIDHYKEVYQENVEFVIGSLFPFITERTCQELRLDAEVVSTKTFDLLRYSRYADIVVMGGGPLMDLNELYVPLLGFKVAKAFKKKTVVFGCGIGPLKKANFESSVQQILFLADEVKLRDQGSIEYARKLKFKGELEFSGDPAKQYIKRIQSDIKSERQSKISCFLREWTFEYYVGSYEDFQIEKEKFERGLAVLIKEKANDFNVDKIEFHHMHNFVFGNDDRDFSRYFINKFFKEDNRVSMNRKLSTVDSIIENMKSSELNICMRFHSVLFADTLNTDYLAIDYTLGGKIHNFLNDLNKLDKKVSINELTLA
jgi:polysaccharide pyruvyl transferase WcaK-like protein/MoaA/NifB/PqqE/SkfB family radical SAM enzyme